MENFMFYVGSINESIRPEHAIVVDKNGHLYAGGWFVDPDEYPGCRVIATFEQVSGKWVREGDYYRCSLDLDAAIN